MFSSAALQPTKDEYEWTVIFPAKEFIKTKNTDN